MILSYFHMIFRSVAFLLYQALSAFARRRQDLERQSVRMRGEAWRPGGSVKMTRPLRVINGVMGGPRNGYRAHISCLING